MGTRTRAGDLAALDAVRLARANGAAISTVLATSASRSNRDVSLQLGVLESAIVWDVIEAILTGAVK